MDGENCWCGWDEKKSRWNLIILKREIYIKNSLSGDNTIADKVVEWKKFFLDFLLFFVLVNLIRKVWSSLGKLMCSDFYVLYGSAISDSGISNNFSFDYGIDL